MKPLLLTLALLGFVTSAAAQEAPSGVFYGVLCYTEEAAVKSALAYQEGGIDLQDEVVDHLINVDADCIRLSQLEALRGYIVYQGATVGDKTVLGVAPNPEGPAQLFGLTNSPDAPQPPAPVGPPKRGA
jgi:hypothetical protein